MMHGIDFTSAKCIVEYGAGTGVFTAKILERRQPDTTVIVFENNAGFYAQLCDKFANADNLHIIHDSAANVGKYLKKYDYVYADYIISGLPFASLPQAVSVKIMEQTRKYLKHSGSFITFQYTLLKKDFIGQYFSSIGIKRELRNVPPAYVLCCRQERF